MPVAMGAGVAGSALSLLSGPAGGAVLQICGGGVRRSGQVGKWARQRPCNWVLGGQAGGPLLRGLYSGVVRTLAFFSCNLLGKGKKGENEGKGE